MFNDKAQVLQVADACFGMPKPESFRMLPHQGRGALDQVRGRRRGRRPLVQFIGLGSHADNLRSTRLEGKAGLAVPSSPGAKVTATAPFRCAA